MPVSCGHKATSPGDVAEVSSVRATSSTGTPITHARWSGV